MTPLGSKIKSAISKTIEKNPEIIEEGSPAAVEPIREQTKLDKVLNIAKYAIGSAFCLFQIYTGCFGNISTQKQTHLFFIFVLGFMFYSCSKKKQTTLTRAIDVLFLLAGIAVSIYSISQYEYLANSIGNPSTMDVIIGALEILCILELTRRSTGKALPILGLIFLIYARWGAYFPGQLAHGGFTWRRIFSYLAFSGEGVLGAPLSACANFIILYLVFAALLDLTGGGNLFIDLGNAIAGRYTGGPAKTAVVASGFFGSISGSAVANVVSTGAFTIPLMKKMGYEPEFAGAVESVASTGGQIMPPVMSEVGFIMAEYLGISYGSIVIAATIPAVLYYASCLIMVHLHARKGGLKGMAPEDIPNAKKLLVKKGFLLIPLLVLIYMLVFRYSSPQKAAVWGIASMLVCSYLSRESRLSPKKIVQALHNAAKTAIPVVAACTTSGIVIGVVTMSGVGLVFTRLIFKASLGSLPLALFLTMLASLILGMGVPTIASYVILALIVGPTLISMGVSPLAAHMFLLYFGVISNITPPVALASFAAAGLAQCDLWKCGLKAFKLGIAGFIVPYMFIYSPGLLMDGSAPHIIYAFAVSLLGVFCLGCALERRMLLNLNIIEAVLMFAAAIMLINTHLLTDAIGLAIAVGIYVIQRINKKKHGDDSNPPAPAVTAA